MCRQAGQCTQSVQCQNFVHGWKEGGGTLGLFNVDSRHNPYVIYTFQSCHQPRAWFVVVVLFTVLVVVLLLLMF